jgi:predicted 2-oxoglutarate/Fe(II)-dependent dioxygenase YbiX/peroxiredoxin
MSMETAGGETGAPNRLHFVRIDAGEPAPWFIQRTSSNPNYNFASVGGRYVLLCFFGSTSAEICAAALRAVEAQRIFFDDENICFFGVTNDPRDEIEGRVADSPPGIRYFYDFDGRVGKLYGALPTAFSQEARNVTMRQMWVVLDPMLRVMKIVPFSRDGEDIREVFSFLAKLPPPAMHAGIEISAPILILPRVFDLPFCRKLIELYETQGNSESGFMRDVAGKTLAINDHSFKRRRDHTIQDKPVIEALQAFIRKRVVPEIRKIHHFNPNRMERYIVSCYDAADNAHFRPHRDNTTKGTAHRRFAVSINLNDDFEGGEVYFPEYGMKTYKAPPGCAIVFSTPMLHGVTPVTAGRRYAFLPFLYDDEAAKIREANNKFLGEGVLAYPGSEA